MNNDLRTQLMNYTRIIETHESFRTSKVYHVIALLSIVVNFIKLNITEV